MVQNISDVRHRKIRVIVLLTAAVVCASRSLAYVFSSESSSQGNQYVSLIDTLVPIQVWAALWAATAVALLAGIFSRVIARWAMSTAGVMFLTWFGSYIFAFVFLSASRAWVTASLFLMCGVYTILFMLLMEARHESFKNVPSADKEFRDKVYAELEKGAADEGEDATHANER